MSAYKKMVVERDGEPQFVIFRESPREVLGFLPDQEVNLALKWFAEAPGPVRKMKDAVLPGGTISTRLVTAQTVEEKAGLFLLDRGYRIVGTSVKAVKKR